MSHLIKYALVVNIAHTLSDICSHVNPFLLYFQAIYTKMDQIVQDFEKRILYQQLVIKAWAANSRPL